MISYLYPCGPVAAYLSNIGLPCMMSGVTPPMAPRAKKINMPMANCKNSNAETARHKSSGVSD